MAVPAGTQLLGEGSIAEFIGAMKDARRWRRVRGLGPKEKLIGQKVFRNTIPWDRVSVTDGLGANGRPFTMPVPMTSPRKYAMHVGPDAYLGMSFRRVDAELLVHELTHIWQGERSKWSWKFVFSSAWHQAVKKDAYAYNSDPDVLAAALWTGYNPEQQANIVEHWFAAGMPGDAYDPAFSFMKDWFTDFEKKGAEYDPRYRFVVTEIRGESMPIQPLTAREDLSTKSATSANMEAPPVDDEMVLDWLAKRYAAQNIKGYKNRIEELRALFRDLPPDRARKYIERLKARKPGDKMAFYFQANLATYERKILMDTLEARTQGRRI